MVIATLGINHHNTPVAIRAQASFSAQGLSQSLNEAKALHGVEEVAILSTCNRTEIFCTLTDTRHHNHAEALSHWLHRCHNKPQGHFSPYIVQRYDCDAVRHLMRISCGLDSMVLGEPQILGQIKQAYAYANSAGTIGQHLSQLFEHTFHVAKQVRSQTSIGTQPVSIASVAVLLAKQIFSQLSQKTALLIGAGDTIDISANHLHTQGIGKLIIANRSLDRAQKIAHKLGGHAIEIHQISDAIAQADIVISSTASEFPVIGKGMVEQAIAQRKHRMMLLIDLAVPPDIEPQVSQLDDIFFYNIDDMEKISSMGQQVRHAAIAEAETIIQNQTDMFMRKLRALNCSDIITALHTRTAQIKDLEVRSAIHSLKTDVPADQVVDKLAHRMSKKFLHDLSVRLREASENDDEATLQAMRKLLGLPDNA